MTVELEERDEGGGGNFLGISHFSLSLQCPWLPSPPIVRCFRRALPRLLATCRIAALLAAVAGRGHILLTRWSGPSLRRLNNRGLQPHAARQLPRGDEAEREEREGEAEQEERGREDGAVRR